MIKQKERIKGRTIQHRRLQQRKIATSQQAQDETDTPLIHNGF